MWCVWPFKCTIKRESWKNEISAFVTPWMDLEGIVLSEISQSEKDKYHMTSRVPAL